MRPQGLTDLEELNLAGTRVTSAGFKKLRQALPKCEITHYPPIFRRPYFSWTSSEAAWLLRQPPVFLNT